MLFFDAEVEVCWLRRSKALAMSVGSSGDKLGIRHGRTRTIHQSFKKYLKERKVRD